MSILRLLRLLRLTRMMRLMKSPRGLACRSGTLVGDICVLQAADEPIRECSFGGIRSRLNRSRCFGCFAASLQDPTPNRALPELLVLIKGMVAASSAVASSMVLRDRQLMKMHLLPRKCIFRCEARTVCQLLQDLTSGLKGSSAASFPMIYFCQFGSGAIRGSAAPQHLHLRNRLHLCLRQSNRTGYHRSVSRLPDSTS